MNEREVNLKIWNDWAKDKPNPVSELALIADVAPETVRKMKNGHCPKTKKVRLKLSKAVSADEDIFFPPIVANAS